MYVEDFGRTREPSPVEADMLRVKVQCPYLPTSTGYEADLRTAGFDTISIHDVTQDWTGFTVERLAQFRANRHRNERVHGKDLVDGLDDFYATVSGLFVGGAISGLKIVAR